MQACSTRDPAGRAGRPSSNTVLIIPPKERPMTKTLEPTLNEIREEAAITRRVLERVPADKLTWKPHPKSMSLGQLAFHIANIPGGITRILQMDEFDTANANFNPPEPRNLEEIKTALDQSLRAAE